MAINYIDCGKTATEISKNYGLAKKLFREISNEFNKLQQNELSPAKKGLLLDIATLLDEAKYKAEKLIKTKGINDE